MVISYQTCIAVSTRLGYRRGKPRQHRHDSRNKKPGKGRAKHHGSTLNAHLADLFDLCQSAHLPLQW